MAKDFFLFPSSEKLENSIVVRFFEHLSGKKLTGFKLKFGYFFGTGIIVAFSLSLIDAAFSLLNSSALGMVAARAAVIFLIFSLFFLALSLLTIVIDKWKENLVAKNKKHEKIISLFFSLSYSVLFVSITLFFLSLYPSSSEDLSKDLEKVQIHDLKRKCVDCSQTEFISENISHTASRVSLNENSNLNSDSSNNEFGTTELESKAFQRVDELLDRLKVENLTEMTKTFDNIKLIQESENQNWGKFLFELDNIPSEDTIYASMYTSRKIFTALLEHAPVSVVLEILNRGHKLNGAHTEVLVTYLGIDEIKALENYGVDFSLADEKGRRSNALIKSLFNNQGPAVYEYLLTKESLLFSQEFDVVKEVLIISSELNRPIQYTQKLIDSGAVVTEKTKEWIESDLRNNHPRYYSLVSSKLLYN